MEERAGIQTDQSSADDLREHVGESFNIYQASIAMIAIFDGFLFASLLQFLSGDAPLTERTKWVVRLLTTALLGFTYAMLCFHSTAHQVIKWWGFFYPKSRFSIVGRWLMNFSLLAMFSALAVMLYGKSMVYLAGIVETAAVGITIFTLVFSGNRRHGRHIVPVDV